jgi:hypothetical protein
LLTSLSVAVTFGGGMDVRNLPTMAPRRGDQSRVADHIKPRDGSQFALFFSISRSPVRQLRCNMVETLAETGDEPHQ